LEPQAIGIYLFIFNIFFLIFNLFNLFFFLAPSSDTIKRHITRNFEEERERLQKKLQEVPGRISITTDIWTTDNNDKSFMSVTIHYLDASWSIKHLLLDFIHMDGQHTGAEIASAMENCLQSIGIISKIIAIMHDNATSNDRFLQDFLTLFHQPVFNLMINNNRYDASLIS